MTGLAPAPQGLFDKCQESAEVSLAPVLAARSEESRIVHQGLNRGRGGGGSKARTQAPWHYYFLGGGSEYLDVFHGSCLELIV